MCKDIEFYYGIRNCGKSEFVEQILSKMDTKVYIGTLPSIQNHLNTIEKHIIRRGEKWITIDLSHNLSSDLNLLENTLCNLPIESACMLDGIWTWYYFTNEKMKLSPELFAHHLVTTIRKYCNIWKLVDISDYVFEKHDPNIRKLNVIHEILVNELNITKLIDYRYEGF